MQIEWILSPLGQCVFLALALIGCLALFLSVKLEIAVVRRSFDKSRESTTTSTATLATELATLREAIGNTEVTRSTGQELNLSRREQALRMQHSGESPATIAAALRVPRNEIDLLLKIQRIAGEQGRTQPNARLTIGA
jgi:hypothetical protein